MYKTILTALAATALTAAAPAHSAVFEFTQGGFSGGGTISGFFVGEDSDLDGEISFFDGEVLDFFATLTGDSIVADTTFDSFDLFGLVYELDGTIGDGCVDDCEGIGATTLADIDYSTGPGPVGFCDGMTICGVVEDFITGGETVTTELVIVTEVDGAIPVPAAALLFAPALAGLGLKRRRKAKA